MRKRWRFSSDVDWEIVAVLGIAAWIACGVVGLVVAGAIFNSETATNIAGAMTLGVPLIVGLTAGAVALCRWLTENGLPIQRVWESSEDLREHASSKATREAA